MVHKRGIGEVLVTSLEQSADDTNRCGIHLPASHLLFSDSPHGQLDSTMLVEAFRQSGLAVAHRHLSAHREAQFVFQRLSASWPVAPMHLRACDATCLVTVEVAKFDPIGELMRCTLVGTIAIAGAVVFQMSGVSRVLAAVTYERLRRGHERTTSRDAPVAGDAVDPSRVGRANVRNVCVGSPVGDLGRFYQAPLRVDTLHPTFFDHPADHVPGLLVIEALRQISVLAVASDPAAPAAPRLTRMETSFDGFVELAEPARCQARAERRIPGGPALVTASISQHDRDVATAKIEVDG
jgi:hypothetical protein